MQEMRDYLHDCGFENSQRTIQRDFEKIRYEFGVNIIYERSRNGYHIAEDSQLNVEQFLRLANLSQLTQIITGPAAKDKDLLNYISFEAKGTLRGLEYIAPVLRAIKQNLKIKISHTTFYRKNTHNYEVWPYMLKEYDERWYVVGWVTEKEEFRSFGVDRIDELVVTNESFDRKLHPDPAPFFKDAIGIIYSNQKPETVELAFHPFQGKYIKTLPLHDSQSILEDNNKVLRIRLHVLPNIELKRKILSYGSEVKVEKPEWLAQEITAEMKKGLGQYE